MAVKSFLQEKAGWLAITGASCILSGFIISAVFFIGSAGEGYSILNHFISELGVPSISPMAIAFNVGLIIGAPLFIPLVVSLGKHMSTKLGMFFGIGSSISGGLVGVFPATEKLLPIHAVVAFSFFIGGMLTVLVFTLVIVREHRRQHSILFPRSVALIGFVPIMIFGGFLFISFSGMVNFSNFSLESFTRPPFWGVAFLEWLSVLSIIGWIVISATHATRIAVHE
ncbi:DUF998 domain-containing protein [Candidatus Bathyarchaeota archaeon]|nr:DUF998 domain-containing protein [Candidatus Bathyarchaeota archaeon]